MSASTVLWQPIASLSSGAHATSTFPNSHLLTPRAPAARAVADPGRLLKATWVAPVKGTPLEDLRQAVAQEDWERNYEEGLTQINMRAEWSASRERCSLLQSIASSNGARRILEMGSFCGVSSLALAESLPDDGEVHAVDIDPFVVDFGKKYQLRSPEGHKIHRSAGPARLLLQRLACEVKAGRLQPFDVAIIDADRESIQEYFDTLWNSPGLLAEGAIVCVDLTPYKGQPPTRYLKFGFPHRWQCESGEKEINAIRERVKSMPDFNWHEVQQLLIVQRKM